MIRLRPPPALKAEMTLSLRPIHLVMLTVVLALSGPMQFAVAKGASADGKALGADFLIANVCLDSKGRTLVGVSPIDGDPRCVSQRDLKVGEPLPYHTRQAGDDGDMTKGSDSFPVNSSTLGLLAVHIYDYAGYLPGATFGAYDPANPIGGGTIASISNRSISFIATQLGPQPLQYFVGGGCSPNRPVDAQALQDGWELAPLDQLASLRLPQEPMAGRAIASGVISEPGRMVSSAQPFCPGQIPVSTTRWSVQPVTYRARYRAGPRQGQHVVLWTLIAEHFGRDPSHMGDALSIERAYFTRELGWTRWEAWKSAAAVRNNPRVEAATQKVMARDNCALPVSAAASAMFAPPTAPRDSSGAPRTDMTLSGCVESTDIVPPRGPYGDAPPVGPGTWLGSLQALGASSPLGVLPR